MSKVFITSDLHLGHSNIIIRYRGFKDVITHDKMIITNWNNKPYINNNEKH